MLRAIDGVPLLELKPFQELEVEKEKGRVKERIRTYKPRARLSDIFSPHGYVCKNYSIRAFGNPSSPDGLVFMVFSKEHTRLRKRVCFFSSNEVKNRIWKTSSKIPNYLKRTLNRISESYETKIQRRKELEKEMKFPKGKIVKPVEDITIYKCLRKGVLVTSEQCLKCSNFVTFRGKNVICRVW